MARVATGPSASTRAHGRSRSCGARVARKLGCGASQLERHGVLSTSTSRRNAISRWSSDAEAPAPLPGTGAVWPSSRWSRWPESNRYATSLIALAALRRACRAHNSMRFSRSSPGTDVSRHRTKPAQEGGQESISAHEERGAGSHGHCSCSTPAAGHRPGCRRHQSSLYAYRLGPMRSIGMEDRLAATDRKLPTVEVVPFAVEVCGGGRV